MWVDAAIFLADAECAKPLAKWGCYAQVNAAGHGIHESFCKLKLLLLWLAGQEPPIM
jgi:hypothetical protein